MNAWLKRNKDSIEAISTFLQAIAVIVGVVFAVNEFVFKNRSSNFEARERVVTLLLDDRYSEDKASLSEYLFDFLGKTDINEIMTIARSHKDFGDRALKMVEFYTRLQACKNSNACDARLAYQLFCARAIQDAVVTFKSGIQQPGWDHPRYPLALDNLFDFSGECLKLEGFEYIPKMWLERRDGHWDMELLKLVEQLDKRWATITEKGRDDKNK